MRGFRVSTARFAAIVLAGTIAYASAAGAQALPVGVTEASSPTSDGERVLHLTADVPGDVARVWAAFATEDGFRAWAVPLARIDLRVGGEIESSYDPRVPLGSGRTIRNQIVALVPERLLVLRNVQAPPDAPFDAATFQQVQTAVVFEPLDAARTRVSVVAGGFRAGPEWDRVYRFFRAGNAYTLAELRRHLGAAAPPTPPGESPPAAKAAAQ